MALHQLVLTTEELWSLIAAAMRVGDLQYEEYGETDQALLDVETKLRDAQFNIMYENEG